MPADAAHTPPVPAVVGATASGKSLVADLMAQRLGFAVLSADSMQVYAGMDVGTGKVPVEQRHVDYYGLDIADPACPYSVASFQQYGRSVIERLFSEGSGCVVCGGTGLYIKALLDDMVFPAGEQVGNPVRDKYNQLVDEHGPHHVWGMLNDVDPASAQAIDPHDAKRIVRAFEMLETGVSYAEQKEAFSQIGAYYPACYIGLRVEPDVLRARIDARVEDMFAQGLVEETERLRAAGADEGLTAKKAIGYAQANAYLDGRMTLDEAKESVKVATHQYAKRQRTWFRKDARITWLDADDNSAEAFEALACEALDVYERACVQLERPDGTDEACGVVS